MSFVNAFELIWIQVHFTVMLHFHLDSIFSSDKAFAPLCHLRSLLYLYQSSFHPVTQFSSQLNIFVLERIKLSPPINNFPPIIEFFSLITNFPSLKHIFHPDEKNFTLIKRNVFGRFLMRPQVSETLIRPITVISNPSTAT